MTPAISPAPRRHIPLIIGLITLGLGILSPQIAEADGFIIIDRPVVLPHPPHHHRHHPRPIHRYLPLEVREHHVNVRIEGSVATTSVDQTFYNPSPQQLEGTYIFPIPVGAEIDKFEMDVNGVMTTAELLDAGKARSIYEEIVRKARDPALMEYSGQGMFKVRIFPIEPHKEKRVKIKYTQILKSDALITEYTYPLNTEKFSSALIKSVSLKAEIESPRVLKSIYSPSHEVGITRKGRHKALVGFEESDTRPDTDFKLLFATAAEKSGPIGLEMLTYRTSGKDGYYMMLLSPGAWEEQKITPKDVVFAVDTSGSMRGKKLEQAKAALTFCLDSLNEGDRFEIIPYATEAAPLFEKLAPANKKQLAKARSFVHDLRATGGTAIEEALVAAAARSPKRAEDAPDRPFQVIFLTDGRPTIGETRPDHILDRLKDSLKKDKNPIRIFSFGIGTDINTKLLDRLAEDTRATTEYVLPEEDIEHKVSRFFSKISQPVMTGLKIKTTEGVRISKRHPKHLPDLFMGDQLVLFGRYSTGKSGGKKSQIILEGSLAGKHSTFSYPAEFRKKSSRHAFIPRLWATRRVGYLLDEIRLHGDTRELKNEVVSLARRWGIVTPYTSYLIIEDEEARNIPIARQSMGRREAAPAVSGDFAGAGGGMLPPSENAGLHRRTLEEKAFDSLSKLDTGDEAVAASRASTKLKGATRLHAEKDAYKESLYGDKVRFAQQATRTVAGKTFYQNSSTWVDSEAPEDAPSKSTRLAFGSEAYYKLLAKSHTIAQWLSIGNDLRVVIDGTLYEITP